MKYAMNDNNERLPVSKFLHWVYEKPDAIFLSQPLPGGGLRDISWREAHEQVSRVAQWLQRFPRGSRIAIYSLNCAHWILADLAIWYAGHVSVPLYPTAGNDNIRHVLEHSESVLVFVGKLHDFADKRKAIPDTCQMVAMHQHHDGLIDWDELVKRELPMLAPVKVDEHELATIIYTSGTTGTPKGVMHSFGNAGFVAENMVSVTQQLGLREGRFFSYLPLAHVAERCAVELAVLVLGGRIFFVESIDHFLRDVKRAQPTVFFGVPRIWLKLQQGMLAKLPEQKLQRLLQLPVLGSWFAALIRRQLGMSRVQVALSGGASIDVELINWWQRLGITILEVYGMTETLAYSHLNFPQRRGIGTVGELLPNAECQFGEDNEILLKHPGVMLGYYRDEALTNETLVDGWVHSGDLGKLDDQGRLIITGRKKELFKTEKGKYVSPVPIEQRLEQLAGFEQVCVIGTGMRQPVAIAALGDKFEDLKATLEQKLQDVLEKLNTQLDPHERLAAIVLVAEQWTTENGLLTPTLKIRRHQVESAYQDKLRKRLNEEQGIIWLSETTDFDQMDSA